MRAKSTALRLLSRPVSWAVEVPSIHSSSDPSLASGPLDRLRST